MTTPLIHAMILLTLTASDGKPAKPPASQPAADAQASQPLFPRRDWSDYKVIAEHNIFVRFQPRPPRPVDRDPQTFTGPPPAPRIDPASLWVLTGIVLEADERVAFLENTQTGAVEQVTEGQAIDAGKIAHVGMNFITLDYKGGSRQIVIGLQLDGSQSSGSSSSSSGTSIFSSAGTGSSTTPPSTASSTPPASPPPTSSDSSMSDIERKMRERRAKQMGH